MRPVGLAPRPRAVANAALRGALTLAGGNGMAVFAETRVPSGLAALLAGVVPLCLIVLRRLAGEHTGC